MSDKIFASLGKLKDYCEKEGFSGWDPFDGLNSRVFKNLPYISKSEFPRLAWIQAFKKNPVNLRKLFLIEKGYNPKGIGLFLNGYCNLYRIDPQQDVLDKINELADRVLKMKTPGYSGNCWGYNFDWQSRAFFQPAYTPTIVASTFIAYALMDAYEVSGNKEYLNQSLNVSEFVLKNLHRTMDSDGDFAFSYSPLDHTQVFNATLLGSRLLARTYHYSHNHELLEAAAKSIRFCMKHQKADGSWTYSNLPFHQWIDNFHTGYNLECLIEYQHYSRDNSFEQHINKGLEYYLNTFFTPAGVPKYYNNSVYPVDVHAPAQLIITLFRLGMIDNHIGLVERVLNWTIDHMQSRQGFFYYQKNNLYTIKIPYMRWSQAWMFYALTTYMLWSKEKKS